MAGARRDTQQLLVSNRSIDHMRSKNSMLLGADAVVLAPPQIQSAGVCHYLFITDRLYGLLELSDRRRVDDEYGARQWRQ